MDTNITVDRANLAITVQLELLQSHLKNASELSTTAHERMTHGDRNGALGCIADLDARLSEANALYGAALVLHCMTPLDEDRGREQSVANIIEGIRERYPGITPWISPGGIFSLRLSCDDGGYISITDPLDGINAEILVDGRQTPPTLEMERYGPDHNILESVYLTSLDEIVAWIDSALSCAGARKSVE